MLASLKYYIDDIRIQIQMDIICTSTDISYCIARTCFYQRYVN
jgi:hypothetical protein